MNVNIDHLIKTQAQFSLDEFRKKDWFTMPLDELQTGLRRLYEISKPDNAHNIAIMTIHRRCEESMKPIRKKHNYDKMIKEMKKLQEKYDAYEKEKEKLIRGYMIQEIRGFIKEKKLV